MSFAKRRVTRRRWAVITAAALVLGSVLIAFWLLYEVTAPDGATSPAAGIAGLAQDRQVPPDAAAAEQASANPAPAERALAEQAPGEPAATSQDPVDPAEQASASEQIVFRSRRALETIDPRELLRQGAVPAANTPK